MTPLESEIIAAVDGTLSVVAVATRIGQSDNIPGVRSAIDVLVLRGELEQDRRGLVRKPGTRGQAKPDTAPVSALRDLLEGEPWGAPPSELVSRLIAEGLSSLEASRAITALRRAGETVTKRGHVVLKKYAGARYGGEGASVVATPPGWSPPGPGRPAPKLTGEQARPSAKNRPRPSASTPTPTRSSPPGRVSTIAAILATMGTDPAPTRDIAQAAGVGIPDARAALGALVERGLARREGTGRWTRYARVDTDTDTDADLGNQGLTPDGPPESEPPSGADVADADADGRPVSRRELLDALEVVEKAVGAVRAILE